MSCKVAKVIVLLFLSCNFLDSAYGIIGGNKSSILEFPYQASIKLKGIGHVCGGGIINRQLILSAASCFPSVNDVTYSGIKNFYVTTGTAFVGPEIYRHDILNVKNHPNYTSGADCNIAVVILKKAMVFDRFRQPLELPNNDKVIAGTLATLSGWGHLNPADNHSTKYEQMKTVEVKIMSKEQCKTSLRVYESITLGLHEICTETGGKGSNYLDIGGPLVVEGVVVGVLVTSGFSYEISTPDVYTEVYPVMDFITKISDNYRKVIEK